MDVKKVRENKKGNIASEIRLQIGKVVLTVFGIIAIVIISILTFEINSSNKEELTLQSESAAWQLADFFDQYRRVVEQVAVNPEVKQIMRETGAGANIVQATQYETVFVDMLNIVKTDSENIMAVWIGDIDANVLTQSDGFTSGEDFDITKRAWYACIEKGDTILTDPYIDASTGKVILSAAAPVYDEDGTALGVAGLDIALSHVSEVMADYTIGLSGYEVLFSEGGVILYHPNEELILKNISEVKSTDNVINAIANSTEAFMRYKLNGDSRYGYVKEVGDTGYMVLSALPLAEYYSKLILCTVIIVIAFGAAIALTFSGVKKMAKKITEPIATLNDIAQSLASGNLDVELHMNVENEIGELGESISKTVDRLKEYITYIDEIAVVLHDMSEGKLHITLKNEYVGEFQKLKDAILNISNSMIGVMQEIRDSAFSVSSGADELANASQMLAEGACAQATSVDALVQNSNSVSEKVEETKTEAEDSASETNRLTQMMENNKVLMNQMMEAMNKIQDTSKKVVGIIQTIEEIASETNLLSLNASIEAARAGEAGKGFAVVAGEIGSLAEASSKAANTTTELINVSMSEIVRGNEIAQNVMKSLVEAVEAVEALNGQINKTASSAVEQAYGISHIQKGIEEISQGISDTSAVAEQSSATSEELAAQAATLNGLIGRFEF